MRRTLGFLRRWATRPGWACLGAWLPLTLVLPTPAALWADCACRAERGCEDSVPEDAPPCEDGPSEDAIDPVHAVLGRLRLPSRPEAPRASGWRPSGRSVGLRLGHGRFASGHFLDDGRALRYWLQSQTC